jgi:hypothetical protein
MLNITKLDRRYNGYRVMEYIVEPDYSHGGRDGRINKFKELREWLWENYGPGCELDYVVLTPTPAGNEGQCYMQSQERWAWDTTENRLRIYVKGDEELSFIRLKWC